MEKETPNENLHFSLSLYNRLVNYITHFLNWTSFFFSLEFNLPRSKKSANESHFLPGRFALAKNFLPHLHENLILFFTHATISVAVSDDEIQGARPSGRFDAEHPADAGIRSLHVQLLCRQQWRPPYHEDGV